MSREFDPQSVTRFRFVAWTYDEAERRAQLDYAFDLDDGRVSEFHEEILFEKAPPLRGEAEQAAFGRALRLLHLIAGVSYYKAAVPPEIVVETGPLSAEVAEFLERLYLHGLGEFAYHNDLDLRGKIRFPSVPVNDGEPPPSPIALPRRTAVPVGGGKDSIVTLEALKEAGEPMVLFSVGDPEPIRETIRVAGLPHILVRRRISPALLELNRRGALNGHVPISAVIAAILTAAAVLYGFDAAALSNESSADEANICWRGLEINHQYSKSSAFESDFSTLIESRVLPGFRYFSFLRPLGELAITAAFSRAPRAYRDVFRSCNAAFRLDETRRARRWCRDCPKCRFVFLAMAPFVQRRELNRIFGGDLLADPAQEQGFAALLGLSEHKPFECVGEVEESRAALALLSVSPEWERAVVIERLATRLGEEELQHARQRTGEILRAGSLDNLPERFRVMLPEIPGPRD